MLDHRHTLFDVKDDIGGFDIVWVFSSATTITTQPRPHIAKVLPRVDHTSIAFTDNSGRVQARYHVNEPLAIARESLETRSARVSIGEEVLPSTLSERQFIRFGERRSKATFL